jgi:hypothetical protein
MATPLRLDDRFSRTVQSLTHQDRPQFACSQIRLYYTQNICVRFVFPRRVEIRYNN